MNNRRFDHAKGLGFVAVREVVTVIDGAVWPVRFEVEGSTGYRAILPACVCVADGMGRTPCGLKSGHGKATKGRTEGCDGRTSGFCHEWHWPRAERFALDVLATFGTGAKTKATQSVGVPRGSSYVERAFVPLVIRT